MDIRQHATSNYMHRFTCHYVISGEKSSRWNIKIYKKTGSGLGPPRPLAFVQPCPMGVTSLSAVRENWWNMSQRCTTTDWLIGPELSSVVYISHYSNVIISINVTNYNRCFTRGYYAVEPGSARLVRSLYITRIHSVYSQSDLGVATSTPRPPLPANPNLFRNLTWFSKVPTSVRLPANRCSQWHRSGRYQDRLKRSRW